MSETFGSCWYKFDFHTHTPASSDYKQRDESEIDWLKALMIKEVDCVAVTDHVSGDWVDRLKTTYQQLMGEEWFRPLYIFPGCEITVSIAQSRVHVLAIFDPRCNSAKITAVLGQCGITEDHGDAENTCATESIERVIDIISTAGGIAIPAHIDSAKGLLNGITNHNQEIDRWLKKIESAEFTNLDFLTHVNPELSFSASHLAKIQGSDAHESSRLGNRFSWIKMSKPSIEGLKLALHDHSFCVDNGDDDPNSVPDLYISNLHISKMNHCGRIPGKPAVFRLHPLFNAIIGGRGSGKSTFIESLRLALGRESDVSELRQIQADVNSFKTGVTNPDTLICAEIKRKNESYQTVWQQGKRSFINKWQGRDWVADHGNPEERFHISLYSQKQINALATNANSLLDIIDRSVDVDLPSWNNLFNDELDRFLGLRREIRILQSRLSNQGTLQAQLDDVISDITGFEQGGHKNLFNAYQTLSSERTKVNELTEVSALKTEIDQLIEKGIPELTLLTADADKPEYVQELEAIQNRFIGRITKIKDDLAAIKLEIEEAETERIQAIASSIWNIQGTRTEESYKAVVEEYKDKGEKFDPKEYEHWLQRRNEIEGLIAELKEANIQLNEKQNDAVKSLWQLYLLRRKLQKNRRKFINRVIGESPYVKMKLVPFANKSSIESQFRSHIGVESTFSSSIYQEEVDSSLLFNLLSKNLSYKDIIRETQKIKQATTLFVSNQDTDNYKVDQRLKNSLQQRAEQQPEVIDRLQAWWPEDKLVVEYAQDIKRGKFENIEKGSAGQKAAAILAFLLSHGDNPIIVDQPEDDLDNALIYQLIVSQIHENKKRRQIIMVTHNPNIVVNGDAEYVNVLQFGGGQVQVKDSGGLCEQNIRDHICEILEGGTAAFDKRYQRLRNV